MVVTVKIDCRLVMLTAIYISIGIAALLLAFPDMSVWVPKNSSEMASWVQVIGVIAAMGITILVSTWPQKNSVKSSVFQAKAFAIILYKNLNYIKKICPGKHEDSFRFYSFFIRDLMETNASFNYGFLPPRIISHYYDLRSACILVNEYSKILERDKDPIILNNLYNILDGMQDIMDEGIREIIQESNSILGVNDSFEEIAKAIDADLKRVVEKGEAIVAARK